MKNGRGEIAILGIGTAVPPYCLKQDETSLRLAEALAEQPDAARWAKRIFKHTGVETRYTCEPNLLEPASRCRYAAGAPPGDVPTTEERMEIYRRESVPLSLDAARQALQNSGMAAGDITHLITVSCTGMFLPGLDIELIGRLGLPARVRRIPLTFLGCAAGLTAVRTAKEIAAENGDANVLIVCVELCTLHIQPSVRREDLYASAFFGDGAGACVVGRAGPNRKGVFALGESHTAIMPGTAGEMVWKIGNNGFHLYLSPRIPELIGQFVPSEIEKLWPETGDGPPELWAIHPGGRGIIDILQNAYGLTDAQTRASRSVLRRFGNMSSATILFVLDEMRRELETSGECPRRGIAIAFGPGMHAELINIAYVPHTVSREGEPDVCAVR